MNSLKKKKKIIFRNKEGITILLIRLIRVSTYYYARLMRYAGNFCYNKHQYKEIFKRTALNECNKIFKILL